MSIISRKKERFFSYLFGLFHFQILCFLHYVSNRCKFCRPLIHHVLLLLQHFSNFEAILQKHLYRKHRGRLVGSSWCYKGKVMMWEYIFFSFRIILCMIPRKISSKGRRESCGQWFVWFCSRTSSSLSNHVVSLRNDGCNFCVSLDNIGIT